MELTLRSDGYAFEEPVERHEKTVPGIACKIIRNHDSAEKEAVKLHYFDGLAAKDIAARKGGFRFGFGHLPLDNGGVRSHITERSVRREEHNGLYGVDEEEQIAKDKLLVRGGAPVPLSMTRSRNIRLAMLLPPKITRCIFSLFSPPIHQGKRRIF